MSKAAKKKEKQDWALEKPKLDNARKLRGIYFINPEDGEYEETIKKRKKESGSSYGSGYALKDGDKKERKEATGNLLRVRAPTLARKQVFQYCGSSRVHKEAFGNYSSKKS